MSIARRFPPTPAESGRATTLFAVVAGIVILGTLGWYALRRSSDRPAVVEPSTLRLAWSPPTDLTLGAGADYPFGLALAPGGRRLAFSAAKAGLVHLWLRDLSTGDTQLLPGTDEGVLPFWAPDGRAIGFFGGGRLKAVTLENGGVADLGAAPSPRGGVWLASGDIVFAPDDRSGLVRRRGAGGELDTLTTPDGAAGETSHRHPAIVDGGRAIVFFVRAAEGSRQGIWIAPLDRFEARKRLVGSEAHALASGNTLLYASGGSLVAQDVDPQAQALVGQPTLVGGPAGVSAHHQLLAALNADLLLFGEPSTGLRELRWVDRGGAPTGLVGESSLAWDLRIAPAGSRVAVAAVDPQLNTLDIFAYDGDRPLPRRISPAIDADESPVWSRDGARLAWVSGRRTVTTRGVMAVLPDEAAHKSEHQLRLTDWSPDGQWFVTSQTRPGTRDDVWLVPASGTGEPRAYAQSPFNEGQGMVSPDGQWLAYASDESGRYEIYVDRFPTAGARARLTSGGGIEPRWNRDGSEIYFRRGAEIHVVRPVFSGSVPEATASDRLFDARVEIRAYDVSADGQRFLLNLPAGQTESRPISVIVNWRSLIARPSAAAVPSRQSTVDRRP
jgi:eukaryotic-like serine/threonine-protein kinase